MAVFLRSLSFNQKQVLITHLVSLEPQSSRYSFLLKLLCGKDCGNDFLDTLLACKQENGASLGQLDGLLLTSIPLLPDLSKEQADALYGCIPDDKKGCLLLSSSWSL